MKVCIVAALTADGFIGKDAHHLSMEWRSKEDGRLFKRLTQEAGVMVMGSKTYGTFRIKRAPPGRRLIIYSSHPELIEGENVEATKEDPYELVTRLKKEGAEGLVVAGGATVYKMFMDNDLVDEMYLTIEPVLFGQGVTLFNGELQTRLKLLDVSKLNDNTVLLHYAVNRDQS